MDFRYAEGVTICTLDEAESAQWAAGDDSRVALELMIEHELIARQDEGAVTMRASDDSELSYLDPA